MVFFFSIMGGLYSVTALFAIGTFITSESVLIGTFITSEGESLNNL